MNQFLADLSGQGMELWTDGRQLFYRAPQEILTSTLLSRVKENKTEILGLLKEETYISKTYPLSYPQRSLWYLYQSAPDSPAYNTAMTMRLLFEVDTDCLLSATQDLLVRHPCLRTSFSQTQSGDKDECTQKVHAYLKAKLEQIDASGLDLEELRQKVQEAHQRPFHLEQGPTFRLNLFSRSPKDHVLLISIHHIVCDGWSMWTIIDELWRMYFAKCGKISAGLADSNQTSLAKLDHSYEEYVRWQAETLASQEGEIHWQYWEKQLSGELPALNLPLDRPRPPVQTYLGHWFTFHFSRELSGQLTEMAQRKGVTLYILLLSAYQMLLHRYSGQDDIIVGCPTTGRSRKHFDGIVGHFVNTIALRADFVGEPTIDDFIEQTRVRVLESFQHQDYPFSLLVDRLNPKRDPGRTPIFQTMFVFQKPHNVTAALDVVTDFYFGSGTMEVNGLEFESFPISQQEGQFDLSMEVTGSAEALKGVLKYNRELFDQETMSSMADHFIELLHGIVKDSTQTVSEIQLVNDREKQKLFMEWNDTGKDWEIQCVHSLFEEQVKRTPDAIAVQMHDNHLTYKELNRRANQFARHLVKQGLTPDSPVGICMDRSLEMIVGILGILKAGGGYVPLDPNYPIERLAYILEDSGISILLVHDHRADLIQREDVAKVKIEADGPAITKEKKSNLNLNLPVENLAYILYTSGSTGKPKGVAMPHRALCNLIYWQNQDTVTEENAKTLQFTTLNFDVSFQEIFSTICSGGTLLLIQEELRQNPAALLHLMKEESIERLFTPYVFLQMLADSVAGDGELFPESLREIITAGEQLRITPAIVDLFRKLKNGILHNQYGPTEAHVVTSFTLDGSPDTWPLLPSIGKAIANSRVFILDKHLQPVPKGVVGELYLGGLCLARGYHNQPEMTEEKFIKNPFGKDQDRLYHTGDLARFLADGNIEFLGRSDHQVKIRGYRVELAEIENHLLAHEEIAGSVVIGRDGKNGSKSLCAYYTGTRKLPVTELKVFLSARIPDYMIPSYFIQLDSIPLLPNKKVDRLSLPRPDRTIPDGLKYQAPRNEVEEKLAEICCEVLELERIGVHDNLFDIGCNSLTTLSIQRRTDDLYPGKITIPDLMQFPSISSLAGLIQTREATVAEKSERDMQFQVFFDAIQPKAKLKNDGLVKSPKSGILGS